MWIDRRTGLDVPVKLSNKGNPKILLILQLRYRCIPLACTLCYMYSTIFTKFLTGLPKIGHAAIVHDPVQIPPYRPCKIVTKQGMLKAL